MKLLGIGSNPKTRKSDNYQDALGGYITAIQYLAPANLSGVNLCPWASEGCIEVCLNSSGRGAMNSIQAARIRKAKLYTEDRPRYMAQLREDLAFFSRKAARLGVIPAARLNGTTDILWERTTIMSEFPEITFYDYSKAPYSVRKKLPPNYKITFSASEKTTDAEILETIAAGHNVAIVFDKLPKTYLGVRVIDGTTHDLRFRDPPHVIVGLLPKGKAKKDTSGFVRRISA